MKQSKEVVIDIIYDEILGFCCPCGGFGKFPKTWQNLKYCPGCGQRLNLMLLKDYNKKHKDKEV